jgi:NADH-quinone oxidoreductase subunit E
MPVLLVLIVLIIGGVAGYLLARYVLHPEPGRPDRAADDPPISEGEPPPAQRATTVDARPERHAEEPRRIEASSARDGDAAAQEAFGDGASVVEATPEAGAEARPDAVSGAELSDRDAEGGVDPHPGVAPADLGRGDGPTDDLQRISGIGPGTAQTLNELGIYRFEQIAAFRPENIAWVDGHLRFKGRIERENWVDQARELVGGSAGSGEGGSGADERPGSLH